MMNNASKPEKKPHDVGGIHPEDIEAERKLGSALHQDEHAVAFWEQKIDAMVVLLANKKLLPDWAPLRAGVETLSTEDYDTLSYYERWAKSAAGIAIDQGWVSKDELDQRVKELMRDQAQKQSR